MVLLPVTRGISGRIVTVIIIIIVACFGLIAGGSSFLPVMSRSVRFWQGICFFFPPATQFDSLTP